MRADVGAAALVRVSHRLQDVWRLALSTVLCACALAAGASRAAPAAPPVATPASAAAAAPVVVIRLDGSVQPAAVRYLERGLAEAARRRAALVVLEIDTPGGLFTSLREMTTAITASPVPVAAYVAPAGARAASAGFFLLVAADVAAMAPGTNAGAAHPVALGADDDKADAAIAKATQDAAALIRALAARRGRPVAAAEAAVIKSRSYAADEALEAKLVELVASRRADLLGALDGRRVTRLDGATVVLDTEGPVVEVEPSFAERLLFVIADPTVAYLLLMAGLLGILVELLGPGLILPGVGGAVSLLLALYALSVLPVSWAGGLLLVLAFALLVAEVFVASFGILALAGAVALVLGSLLLFEPGSVAPTAPGLGLVIPTALVFLGLSLFLAVQAVRAGRRRARTGAEELVGERGEALSPLAPGSPGGRVLVRGESWEATAPQPVPRGARVEIVGTEGRRLRVRPLEQVPVT